MRVTLVRRKLAAGGDDLAAATEHKVSAASAKPARHARRGADAVRGHQDAAANTCAGDATLLERFGISRLRLRRTMAPHHRRAAAKEDVIATSIVTRLVRSFRHMLSAISRAVASFVPWRRRSGVGRASLGEDGAATAPPHRHTAARAYGRGEAPCGLAGSAQPSVEQMDGVAQTPQARPPNAPDAALAHPLPHARGRAQTCDEGNIPPALEVVIGRDHIGLSPELSREEAIARVEKHLRGTRDTAGPSDHREAEAQAARD